MPVATSTGRIAPPVITVRPTPSPNVSNVAIGRFTMALTMPNNPFQKLSIFSLKDILPSSLPSVQTLSLSLIQMLNQFAFLGFVFDAVKFLASL